jgi:hypothetical protein
VQDNDESLSQKSDSPSSIETETDSGVSLTSSENDAVTEDELNDVSMDVTEKPMAACGGFDDAEESQSIQDLKGPEVRDLQSEILTKVFVVNRLVHFCRLVHSSKHEQYSADHTLNISNTNIPSILHV